MSWAVRFFFGCWECRSRSSSCSHYSITRYNKAGAVSDSNRTETAPARGTHKKIPRPRPGEVFDQRQQLTLVLLILAAVLSAFSGLLLLLTGLLTAALLLAGLVVATLLLLVRTLVRILLVRIVHNLSCFGFSPQLNNSGDDIPFLIADESLNAAIETYLRASTARTACVTQDLAMTWSISQGTI
jgi:hypothetical protein